MKTTIKEPKVSPAIKPPYLMASEWNVILVTENNGGECFTGIVVAKISKDAVHEIGKYGTKWTNDDFKVWNGEVTLSN